MVAVTEACPAVPGDVPPPPPTDPFPVIADRVVAIAVTARELCSGSDLARTLGPGGPVDLLVACAPGGPDDTELDPEAEPDDEVVPTPPGLALHRLALPGPLTAAAEGDLVAALSELVGFDPEAGVTVVAPAPRPGDPESTVADRAARRIAEVYGLALRHYRSG